MADDYAGSTATSGTVSVGGSKTGSIEIVDDTDWFRITLTAGATYRFDLEGAPTGAGSLADTFLRLRDPAGNSITFDDDGGSGLNSRILSYTPTISGTYYLSVGSANSGTGTYRVSATQTSAPPSVDDYASSTSTTGNVSVGGSKTGNIEAAGDTDWFKTTLISGRVYQVDVEGDATGEGTLGDPYGSLRNSSGTKVAENDDSGTGANSRFTYTVPAGGGGTYYVAGGSSDNGTGTYRIRLTDITPPAVTDDYGSSTSTTGTVSVGGSRTGSIETSGDTDWFATTLVAGRVYQVEVKGNPAGQGTLGDPYGSLRNSAGTKVAEADNGGTGLDTRFTYTVPTGGGGTYYLAAGSNNNGTGTYRVQLTDVTPAVTDDYASSTSTTGTVSVGGSKTGSLETAGDTDWFKANLTPGRTYQIDVEGSPTGNGTLADAYGSLRNSAGAKVAEADDGGTGLNTRFTYIVPSGSDGVFYVAAGSNDNGTGTYRVRLTDVTSPTGTDDYSASTNTTGSVGIGGTKTGVLETAGDTDWFKTSLTPGKTYQFDVEGSPTGYGTLSDAYGSVRNSAGVKVAEADDGGTGFNTRFTYTVPGSSDGNFYVAAGSNDNGTGTYRVRVTEVAGTTPAGDDFADEATDTTAPIGSLPPGGSISGIIGAADANDSFGDKDVFKVSLVAGQAYEFKLQSSSVVGSALPSGLFTIRDPSNFNDVRLTSGSGSSLSETYIADKTGLYYVRVGSGGSSTDRGGYVLSASPATVASGTTYSLTPASLSVTEGSQLVFTITRSGDKPNATVYFSTLSDGTATYGEGDYTTTSGGRPNNVAVHFAEGIATATVTLNIRNDGASDSGEQFRAIIQSAPGDSATPYLARSAYVRIDDQNQSDNTNDINGPAGVLAYFATVAYAAEPSLILRYPVGNGTYVSQERNDDDYYQANDLGVRLSPSVSRYHLGEDWHYHRSATEVGQPVFSIGKGEVVYARAHSFAAPAGTPENITFGNLVIIKHDLGTEGVFYSLYAHLNEIKVGLGHIGKGIEIGTIGATGAAQGNPHLHFEIFSIQGNSTYLTYLREGTPNLSNIRWAYTDNEAANFAEPSREITYVEKYNEGDFTWYNPSMFIDRPRTTNQITANPEYKNIFHETINEFENSVSTIAARGKDVIVSTSRAAGEYILTGYEKVKIAGSNAVDILKVFSLFGTTISQETVYFDGGAGDDVLDGRLTEHSLTAEGGLGTDELTGGTGDDVFNGGDGNDRLSGGNGNDLLDGGAGADRMIGGLGDDIYFVDDAGDVVIDTGGTDEIRTRLADTTAAAGIEKITGLLNSGQVLRGNALDNIIAGGAGADRMAGGLGNDVYLVGAGDLALEKPGEGIDEVRTALASYALRSDVEWLTGTSATGQVLTGNLLANVITGGAGKDVIDGGAGADRMVGGLGDDVYFVDDAKDVVIDTGGTDEVRTRLADTTAAAGIEKITGLLNSGQVLRGNALDNVIAGGAGADRMAGGLGNDVYLVGAGDLALEKPGEGIDEVRTALASYALRSDVEWLTGTSATGQVLTGNMLANVITGGSGKDVIDGGAGADRMEGGLGDDVYFVDDAKDVVIDTGGTDEIRTRLADTTAAAGIEKITGLLNSGQVLRGNALDNVIAGGAGADRMAGGLGDDVYLVGAGDLALEKPGEGIDEVRTALASYALRSDVEWLTGTSAAGQVLTGNMLANVITGGAGKDVIDGGAGADRMIGGLGDDVYFVDDARDVVIDTGGTDEVRTRLADTTAAAGIEKITGLLNSGQVLRGNALDNVIAGGAGADRMAGGLGNDVYLVGAGDLALEKPGEGIDEVRTALASYALRSDVEWLTGTSAAGQVLTGNMLANVITGGAGKDVIDGGAGADRMIGGLGDDVYFVDDARDVVIDTGGTDEIRTRLADTTAAAGIEKITGLLNSGQVLRGNALDNVIAGGAGADRMAGGLGNDVYLVGAGDLALEKPGEGIDEVRTALASYALRSDVEWLTGTSAAGQALTGNMLANVITGGSGNDRIDGGLGADSLAGGSGADIFAYNSSADSTGSSTDRILDFAPGSDKIDLGKIDANSNAAGNQAFSWIGSGAFSGSAGQLRAYQQGGGWILEGDTDGDGVADLVVSLVVQGPTPLSADDFLL